MGKAAENEKLKLRATFLNNLAVSVLVTGFIVPYFALLSAYYEQTTKIQFSAPRQTSERAFEALRMMGREFDGHKFVLLIALALGAVVAAAGARTFANRTLDKIID